MPAHNQLRIHAQMQNMGMSIHLTPFIMGADGNPNGCLAGPIAMRQFTEEERHGGIFTEHPPGIDITETAARLLMSELWRLGIRPVDQIQPTNTEAIITAKGETIELLRHELDRRDQESSELRKAVFSTLDFLQNPNKS